MHSRECFRKSCKLKSFLKRKDVEEFFQIFFCFGENEEKLLLCSTMQRTTNENFQIIYSCKNFSNAKLSVYENQLQIFLSSVFKILTRNALHDTYLFELIFTSVSWGNSSMQVSIEKEISELKLTEEYCLFLCI